MDDSKSFEDLEGLASRYKNLTREQFAEEAVKIATRQLLASTDFKAPRMKRLAKYWELYDGKTGKKLRQLFNVPIPVFSGMIDTLNALHNSPIQLSFKEGEASDYFKVQKINAAFRMETMNTDSSSKWDGKLRMLRKHAIMNGVAIPKIYAESDPEYRSVFDVVNLKNFHFQPRGGLDLENHLFAGEENIEVTQSEIVERAVQGLYDKKQVTALLQRTANNDYLPVPDNQEASVKLSRFKPLGLDPDKSSYVGQHVYNLCQWVMEMDGKRWLLVFHPWTQTWVRFDKWDELAVAGRYSWTPYTTHEDDENLLSKSDADDLYPAADAIIAMFNQELTNREKKNFGARAFDKDMFPDVRKLDEAMHRPDALVSADTKGGTRRIAEGIYKFEVADLNGTVNLIDWMTSSVGRNVGATDLSMGSTQEVSKKASVSFAEQKSVSKRIGWASEPFQQMMAQIGKRYVDGLKMHMPSKLAVRVLGEDGWDWDEITRLDLDLKKDVDVLIVSTDKQIQDSEMKKEKRKEALAAIGADPLLAPQVNPKWRAEEILRSVGEYDDTDLASATDLKTYSDKKALAKASEAIQVILNGKKPMQWYGANIAFIQRIVDFANDRRSTLGAKFDVLLEYAMSHKDIARQNLERKVAEDMNTQTQMQPQAVAEQRPQEAVNPGVSGGMSRAMQVAEQMTS
jgi:hypothetical protein